MAMLYRKILFLLVLLSSSYCYSYSNVTALEVELIAKRNVILDRYDEANTTLLKTGLISNEIFNSLFSSNILDRSLIYLGRNIEIPKDSSLEDIIEMLENKANTGDGFAIMMLSLINIYYLNDCTTGVSLLERAIKIKMVVAYSTYGRLSEFGDCDFKLSIKDAVSWYEKSISSGEPEAMYRLSVLLFSGKYKSDAKWFDLLLAAANRGLPSAQEVLARIYLAKGREYYEESFAWFLMSYVQGKDVLDDLLRFEKYNIDLNAEVIRRIVNVHGRNRHYVFEYSDIYKGEIIGK